MDNLPPEILCDIFQECLPRKGNGRFDVPFSASVIAPLYISHVCRSWRTLSLSYGGLWSHLYIDFKTASRRKKYRTMVDIFDTWLQRTNGAPLNFAFHCLYHIRGECHKAAQYIIRTLLEHQWRWKAMHMFWYLDELPSDFPDLTLTNLPALTSLNLWFDLSNCDGRRLGAAVDISQSSRLRNLAIHGHFTFTTGGEPLDAITGSSELLFHYARTSAAVHSCLEYLKSAPSLTAFRAEFGCIDTEVPFQLTNEHPLVLPSLSVLKLNNDRAAAVILDNITLPSLEALEYGYSSHGPSEEALLRFVQRSMPPLSFLEINGGTSANEDSLLPILRMLPTLRDLRITAADVSTRFFREFIIGDMTDHESLGVIEHVMCPMLLSLRLSSLRFAEDSNTCIVALVDMAKSRCNASGMLNNAILDFAEEGLTELAVPDIEEAMDVLKCCVTNPEYQLRLEGNNMPPYPFPCWWNTE